MQTSDVSAQAMVGDVSLFKIITPRDEIIIGIPKSLAGARKSGSGGVDYLTTTLAETGHLVVWQFAVSKQPDGALAFGPQQQVGLLAHDTLRIEAYVPAIPISTVP